MQRSKRKDRKILMKVMAAILSLALTGIAALVAVAGGTLESRVCTMMENSDYFTAQAAYIEDRAQTLTIEAGLDASIVEGLFDSETVLNETKEYTFNCIKGYSDDLNVDEVKETLRANLYSYMETEGIAKSTLQMDALNVYLGQIASVYEQTVNHPFLLYFHELSQTVAKKALIIICILVLICIACIVFIHALIKMRRKTISYVIRSLIASVWMIVIPAGLAIGMGWYKKIAITPAYIEGFAKSFINGIAWMYLDMGFVWLVLIIGCVIAIRVIASKKVH